MYEISKRMFDLVTAAVALLLGLPLLIVLSIVIRIGLGSPVVFRQTRPGKSGHPFVIYKFRTMTDRRDGSGALLPDSERLTRLGKLIRGLSLDEVLQLWNVIKGELSLVGPRPLLMEYLPLYNKEQARRHDVKPGITGWAQVNGRNAVGWDERFAYDCWYVGNCSFWLDLKILMMTVSNVILRRGISQSGSATMEKFRGNDG